MAAAAATAGTAKSAAATPTTTSRFAAACGALSQYVKAAEAERTTRALHPPPVRPLPLMPGADVDQQEEEEPETATAAQLTIVYSRRALVLDGVTADRAADLLRLAAAAARGGTSTTEQPLSTVAVADLPVARKASLQRFMEKRKGRVAARAEPYRRPAADDRRDDHLMLTL